ncbi:MAG: helix-turn-helix domain-containing protein [Candidatus Sericytochromatia bacterium]
MPKPTPLHLAVKTLREQLALTQKELADQLGVSPVYISYLENGTRSPSRKLLKKAYQLAGQDLPAELLALLETAVPATAEPERSNSIYQLQAQGLYSLAKLQRLVKSHPDKLLYVLGLYQLYCEQQRATDAEQVILNALPHMRAPEDRLWLEAYLFQREGSGSGYRRALALMTEALEIFERSHDPRASETAEKKAEMLFRLSLIHYDFGVWFFHQPPLLAPAQLEAARAQFEAALARHRQLRSCAPYPYAQLDYANLWFWLALLSRYQSPPPSGTLAVRQRHEEQEALQQFIAASQDAMIWHHQQNWSGQQSGGLFTREYQILNHAYVALAHAQLAELGEGDPLAHLRTGEWIFAQHMPLQSQDPSTVYRFFYNLAHFYSIKAQLLAQFGHSEAAQQALDLSLRGVREAQQADAASLSQDLILPLELRYVRDQRPDVFEAYAEGKTHDS